MQQVFFNRFPAFVMLTLCLCVVVLTGLFGLLVVRVDELARVSTIQVKTFGQFVNEDPRGVKGTFANTNAILVQMGLAADALRRASIKQSDYWDRTQVDLTKTIDNVNRILESTNKAVIRMDSAVGELHSLVEKTKDGPVAESALLMKNLQAATTDARVHMGVTQVSLNNVISEMHSTVKQTNQIIAKSQVESSMANLNAASASLSQSSANVAETTGYVRDMFKPTKKSFWRALVESWLPIGVKSIIPQRTIIQGVPKVEVAK